MKLGFECRENMLHTYVHRMLHTNEKESTIFIMEMKTMVIAPEKKRNSRRRTLTHTAVLGD